jgi:putative ABC transport system substrate-binding protein
MKARRNFLIALGAGALAAPLASFAQQQRKVWHIGVLAPTASDSKPGEPNPYALAFLTEMQAAGLAFGVDYVIEARYADGDYDRLPALANELVRLNVDIIMAVSPAAARAAQKASATLPIVFVGVPDPVGLGMAASLARPGGNLTGLASFYAELIPKQLELLKSILPKATRVAFLANASIEKGTAAEQTVRDVMQKLGMHLQMVSVESAEQLPRAFAAMKRERAGAFIALADPTFMRDRREIAELALTHRLPSFFANRENVQAGGLVSYGENILDIFGQAARYVSKIMRGAKPGDLPIEQPTKFHLAVNRKTAAALKLAIPPELLLRADEVIE